VGELLRRGEKILGFGPFVYRSGDPRAVVLLGLVRCAAPRSGQLAVACTAGWIAAPSRPTQAAVRYVPALSLPAACDHRPVMPWLSVTDS